MDLKELLNSRDTMLRKEDFGQLIGTSPETFKELISLALSGEMPVCWRAMWMADHLAELDPSLPHSFIDRFWQSMSEDLEVGVRRSMMRLLCRYDIPEVYQSVATDLCLDWLQQASVPVAIKAYSMEILLKIAKLYPELKHEFIAIINDQLPYNQQGGYISRARNITKAMEKL